MLAYSCSILELILTLLMSDKKKVLLNLKVPKKAALSAQKRDIRIKNLTLEPQTTTTIKRPNINYQKTTSTVKLCD